MITNDMTKTQKEALLLLAGWRAVPRSQLIDKDKGLTSIQRTRWHNKYSGYVLVTDDPLWHTPKEFVPMLYGLDGAIDVMQLHHANKPKGD